jgi:hypothetical protein
MVRLGEGQLQGCCAIAPIGYLLSVLIVVVLCGVVTTPLLHPTGEGLAP